MRTISKKDIEWKNTPMLIKFLNEQGKLFNRYQSRLPTSTHRKVAKTVKKMRNLGILPYVGLIAPTDKIPVGSYIQDIEELHKKTIDPVTGRMFMKHSITDDLRDKRIREKAMVDRKSSKIASLAEDKSEKEEEAFRSKMVREMQLDTTFVEFPSSLSREWSIAQAHLLGKMARTETERQEALKDDPVEFELGQQTYETVMTRLGSRTTKIDSQMGSNLFEDLLLEKA